MGPPHTPTPSLRRQIALSSWGSGRRPGPIDPNITGFLREPRYQPASFTSNRTQAGVSLEHRF